MSESGFDSLGLTERVLATIAELGFTTPTPIQEQAIPLLAEGRDLIGKAETGTGKTLAFTAPMIGHLDSERVCVQGLVLCPTRELAQQVEAVAHRVGENCNIGTALLVGGLHASPQILALRGGAQLVVGTPGRVLDLLRQGVLRLGWLTHLVLDEADRMLDMGFIDDVTEILERSATERQTMLFSATVPPGLQRLARRFMKDPVTISTHSGVMTVPEIRQRYLRLHTGDKEGFILDLLDDYPDDTCIVFCNTRRDVIDLDRMLWGLGYSAGSLHGDHDQDRRFKVLSAFKKRVLKTLVATDVAARGLDIEKVTRIINFDVPEDLETYVHRIGRTGRAGGSGETVTLVGAAEWPNFRRILREAQFEIEEIEDWEPTRPRKATAPARRRGPPPGRRRTSSSERSERGGRSDRERGGRSARRPGERRHDRPSHEGEKRVRAGSGSRSGSGGRGAHDHQSGGGEGSGGGGNRRRSRRPPAKTGNSSHRPANDRSTGERPAEGGARRRRRRPRRNKPASS